MMCRSAETFGTARERSLDVEALKRVCENPKL